MKLDLITFEKMGGSTSNDLRIKRYDFSNIDKNLPKQPVYHTPLHPRSRRAYGLYSETVKNAFLGRRPYAQPIGRMMRVYDLNS